MTVRRSQRHNREQCLFCSELSVAPQCSMGTWGRLTAVKGGLARWSSLAALGTAAAYSLASENRPVHAESGAPDPLPAAREGTGQFSLPGKESVHREGQTQRPEFQSGTLPAHSVSPPHGWAPEAPRGQGAPQGPGAAALPALSAQGDSHRRTPGTPLPEPAAAPTHDHGTPTRPAPGGPEGARYLRTSLPSSPYPASRPPLASSLSPAASSYPTSSPYPASNPSPASSPPPAPEDRASAPPPASAAEAKEYVRKKAQGWESPHAGPLPAVSAATKGDQLFLRFPGTPDADLAHLLIAVTARLGAPSQSEGAPGHPTGSEGGAPASAPQAGGGAEGTADGPSAPAQGAPAQSTDSRLGARAVILQAWDSSSVNGAASASGVARGDLELGAGAVLTAEQRTTDGAPAEGALTMSVFIPLIGHADPEVEFAKSGGAFTARELDAVALALRLANTPSAAVHHLELELDRALSALSSPSPPPLPPTLGPGGHTAGQPPGAPRQQPGGEPFGGRKAQAFGAPGAGKDGSGKVPVPAEGRGREGRGGGSAAQDEKARAAARKLEALGARVFGLRGPGEASSRPPTSPSASGVGATSEAAASEVAAEDAGGLASSGGGAREGAERGGRGGEGGGGVSVSLWEGVAGYDEQKRQIEDTLLLALQHPDLYDSIARSTRKVFQTNRPRAVLFAGPPGTGKTSCARVISKQSGLPLVYLPLEAVASKYYGESEQLLASVFALTADLSASGALLFLDEIDALATARDSDMHEATRRILSVLLRELDGFEGNKGVVVIAATNRREDLDPALLSRFDSSIEFPLPDKETRAGIFGQYVQHLPPQALCQLASASEGLSGRDIRDVCELAERQWAAKILRDHKLTDPPLGDILVQRGLPPLDLYVQGTKQRKKQH